MVHWICDIEGLYFENRLYKSFNWITKIEFTVRSIEYSCEKIFSDHINGSKSKPFGLDKVIEFVKYGDMIVVWRHDILGRNLEDLIT